ncbi:MAG: transposase [Planctomycetes bacterium]|nr:transposase [Planctomycetota bacterium]
MRRGANRNFQVFTALDFLAEVTQHIPEKGEHLVRYYGWYSHRRRGMRKGAGSFSVVSGTALAAGDSTLARSASEGVSTTAIPRSSSVWAMLIKRIYEIDPLQCPKCGGAMKIISFIERGQTDVIERILKHCGLWEGPIRTFAGPRPPPGTGPPTSAESEYELVLDGEFLEAESLESRLQSASRQVRHAEPGDYQLVLDPEFL